MVEVECDGVNQANLVLQYNFHSVIVEIILPRHILECSFSRMAFRILYLRE